MGDSSQVYNQLPRSTQPGHPSRVSAVTTGEVYAHCQGRNGEFYDAVGPVGKTHVHQLNDFAIKSSVPSLRVQYQVFLYNSSNNNNSNKYKYNNYNFICRSSCISLV